ncbi:MAG: SDR family oxidoreductase [Ignavibacteriaceae bacterium]
MEFGIKYKTALVTAASKGIGKAVAEALIDEGCNVAICSSSKDNLVQAASDILKKTGVEPFWVVCDLLKASDIENTFNAVTEKLGPIDILVNNCGGPVPGLFNELDEEDWFDAFNHVLMSTVRFSRLVTRDMIKKEWGRIINITSVSVKQPIPNLMLSNTLRNGVIGFAKTLSNELAKYNITVNNVAPGFTLTHRLYELAVLRAKESGLSHEEVLAEMAKQVPMNRLGGPEEIASVVAFIASRQAGYLTGNTIHVDGGHIKNIY